MEPALNSDTRMFLAAGCVAAFIAVMLGAFGAHALKDQLSPELASVYHTAVSYHFYHALGLLALGLTATQLASSALLRWAGALMIAGLVLFSGSLYALAFTGMRGLGMITPVGGICLLCAWALFAAAVLRRGATAR